MTHGEKTSAGMSVGKYGGITQSPLQTQAELWQAFADIANGLDPDVAWDNLTTGYIRDFIQGMWIAKAVNQGRV